MESIREMMKSAIDDYQDDKPVIVFVEDELVHGGEELQAIISTGVPLDCRVIHLEISMDEWNKSEWPEIYAAARELWLSENLPGLKG
jgi:hypothetical protein